jgi:hypothetical protein
MDISKPSLDIDQYSQSKDFIQKYSRFPHDGSVK